MGLFSKPNYGTGRGRDRGTVIDFSAPDPVSTSRAESANELVSEAPQARANGGSRSQTPIVSFGEPFPVDGNPQLPPIQSIPERSRSESRSRLARGSNSPRKNWNARASPTLGLNRGIHALELQGVEELTPMSDISPQDGKFPDASTHAKSELEKWSTRSPRKGSTSARQAPGSAASSANRRMAIVARTNSISRLARAKTSDATGLKRNVSALSLVQRHDSATGTMGQIYTPTEADPSHGTGSPRASVFSASPTTPHGSIDTKSSPVFPVTPPDSSEKADGKSRKDTASHVVAQELAFDSTTTTVPDKSLGRNQHQKTGSSGQEPTGVILGKDTRPGKVPTNEDVPPGVARECNQWDRLEVSEFCDVYGLETVTGAAVSSGHVPPNRDKLHNSPTGQTSQPFVVGSLTTASSAGKALQSVDVQDSSAPVPSPKRKPKQRKRPPPLLKPDSPSGTNTPGSSPHTGVFSSNGDFKTGGFRITAEGMVGKPERVTRTDSDDAPSMGTVPATIGSLAIVKSLSELRKGPTLGMGAAGRVYLAIHEPSAKSMAIKVVNVYDEGRRNQLLKELDTLSSHVSRFLVKFYGAFYDGKGAVHIALEFMDAGCLHSTISKFGAIPESVTRAIATDCLRALRFLHRNNVLHRDFKTANILLSRKALCAKVSDFGLARDMDANVSRVDTFVGTVAYMSPERLHGTKYTYASDIWALGISIAECLLGRYPFEKPQSFFDYLETMSTCTDMLRDAPVSPEAASFVRVCTRTDPAQRPEAAVLMEHPWIKGKTRDTGGFREWMDDMAAQKSRDAATMRSIQSVRSFLGPGRR